MKQRKWPFEECSRELAYIKSINPSKPSSNFNYDPECFRKYCEHQAETFTRSGFPELAAQALEHAWRGRRD